MLTNIKKPGMADRFRGLLPVVIDVETSGLSSVNHSILEIAAVTLALDESGQLSIDEVLGYQVEPFQEASITEESLMITGIDPDQPLRYAIPEQQALRRLFSHIKVALEKNQCQRAVLVGHNAWFDLSFLQAAIERTKIQDSPFHSFTTFDTATLAGVVLGETVLARAVKAAGIQFDVGQAHSAIYDAVKTAELFCHIVNKQK